jgi:hypothetical protein
MTKHYINKSRLKLRLLPSVTKFLVKTKDAVPTSLLFGILKFKRTYHIDPSTRLDQRNKYLRRSYQRLISYARKGDSQQFERLARILITNSATYQLAMLHSATNDWYTKSTKEVRLLWSRITRVRSSTDLNYQRWWIDKKPGDYARPIGAPTLEWKVNMLKYLQVLEIYYHTNGKYPQWQHAGTSGRGLVTAWSEVMLKALRAKYIYEFDLRGFFDNIANQNSTPELPWLNDMLNKMVNKKPRVYNLPPEETFTEQDKQKASEKSLYAVYGLLYRTSGLYGMGSWPTPHAQFPA